MPRSAKVPTLALLEMASDQRGLVTRAQVVQAELSRHAVRRLIDEGWLRRVRHGVYAVGGYHASSWDPAVAALLVAGPGAVLSHTSAAAIHRFPGLAAVPRHPDLTVVIPRHPRVYGAILHRVSRLDPIDVTGRPPLLLTSPTRTLVDLADTVPAAQLATIVDEGTSSRRWTVEDLWSARARAGERRRPGTRVLDQILAARQAEPQVDSPLELRVVRVLAPLGPFETQYQLVIDNQIVIIDVAWPKVRVGVEVDGFAVHGRSRSRFDNDRHRANLLTAHGWRVAHVTSAMDDDTILRSVRRILPLGGAGGLSEGSGAGPGRKPEVRRDAEGI